MIRLWRDTEKGLLPRVVSGGVEDGMGDGQGVHSVPVGGPDGARVAGLQGADEGFVFELERPGGGV